MSDAYSVLFGTDDLSVIPTEYFLNFRKFCASETDAAESFIERIDQSALNRFSLGLLETVIKLLDDFEDIDELGYDDDALRRSKILMQTFVNMANRSPRFLELFVTHWMTLLRLESIRLEVLASLYCLVRDMHKETFVHLLSDLATLWNQVSAPNEHRNWISALYGILFEDDYSFLAECRTTMSRESFTDVLFIAETYMEHALEREVMVHPGNIRFCVDYLEQIDLEVAINVINCDIGLRIYLCTDIISSASVYRPIYEDCLHNEQRAIKIVCGYLKMLLEAEDYRRRETEAIRAANAASALRRVNRRQRVTNKFVVENVVLRKESESEKSQTTTTTTINDTSENLENSTGDLSLNSEDKSFLNQSKKMDCNNLFNDNLNPEVKEEKDISDSKAASNGKHKIIIQSDNESSNKSENVVMMDESSRSNMSVDTESLCSPPSTKQYKLSNNENNGIAVQKPEQQNSDSSILRHKEISTDDNTENSSKNSKNMASTSAVATILETLNECTTNTLKSNAQMRRLVLTRQISPHIAMNMREALIRAVGNLCSDSPKNIFTAGTELNAVNMLGELALCALKNLCADSVENQSKLIECVELTNEAFDSFRLFSAIGFEVIQDEETGKIVALKKSLTKPFFNQVNMPRNGVVSSSSSSSESSSNISPCGDTGKEEEFIV